MNIIETMELTKKYGKLVALDKLSLNVERGMVFGLLGPNGAGKSTTIRILATLIKPSSGTAFVCGHNIFKEQSKVRSKIGVASEKIILYEKLTAKENLLLFARLKGLSGSVAENKVRELLHSVEMEQWKDIRVSKYSKGMKQRINLLRAFINDPELIFLDEPTVGLDPQTTRIVRKLIQHCRESGKTVVLTTHIMYEVELLADTVGIIDNGKLLLKGKPEEIRCTYNRKLSVELKSVYDNNTLLKKLSGFPEIMEIHELNNEKIIVDLKDRNELKSFLNSLKKNSLEITYLSIVEPSLEDIFIDLTGKSARDCPK